MDFQEVTYKSIFVIAMCTNKKSTKAVPIEEQLTPASRVCVQPVLPIEVEERGHETSDDSFPVHDRPVNRIGDTL